MKYLHSMLRVKNLDESLRFFIEVVGLKEIQRKESESGRFTLVFLATAENEPCIELTYNWDETEGYTGGRNFGHLAYEVENIYEYCEHLQKHDVTVLRPPRDGKMAFFK